MYKIEWKNEILPLLILAAVIFTAVYTYGIMSANIPIHWDIRGKIDVTVPKSIWSAALFPLLIAGCYFLMLFTPLLDSRIKPSGQFNSVYPIIRMGVFIVLVLVYGIIVAASLGYRPSVAKIVPAALSALFLVIGNYLPKVRKNWFVGGKVHGPLSNNEVWNRTNRFGGKMFILAGILGLIGTMMSEVWTAILFFTGLLLASLTPVLYSNALHHRIKNGRRKR